MRFGYGQMTEASYALVRVTECRGGASLAAIGADHQRRDDAPAAAAPRCRSRSRRAGLEALGVAAVGARGLLAGVPRRA